VHRTYFGIHYTEVVEVCSLALDFSISQKSFIHKIIVDGRYQDNALGTGLLLNQNCHRSACHYYNKTVSLVH